MAFIMSNLAQQSYGNGKNTFRYDSGTDNLAACTTADYFLAAQSMLGVGDVILIAASDGVGWRYVDASTSSTVTVAALT